MRATIYCRISRDDEGLSLGVERQREDCERLAEQRGWDVVGTYTDNDLSAYSGKPRPAWEKMLEIFSRGEADAIVAYSSSRMYRRVAELTRLIDLVNTKGISIATVSSGDVNLDTADGRMIAGILAQVDQGEVERIKERVIRKRQSLVAEGKWTGGHRPFGYQDVPAEGGGKKLEVVETEAEMMRAAATAVLNGVSLASITRLWNGEGISTTGGKPWSKTHLRVMLSRPAPGIIVETDHRRLLDLFDGRKYETKMRGQYLLTGLAYCGLCGNALTGAPRSGVPRYVCKAGLKPDGTTGKLHLSVQTEGLDDYVKGWADRMEAPALTVVADPTEPLVQQRETILAEMEALGREWSDLPEAVLRARSATLSHELTRVDHILSNQGVLTGEALTEALTAARERGNFPRQRLETLIQKVVVAKAERHGNTFDSERVSIEWRPNVEEVM